MKHVRHIVLFAVLMALHASVAQVSYHGPDDQGSPEIRGAQKEVCDSGLALPGPDTDELQGDLRERNGAGVHFSGKGLREHAARWFDIVSASLDERLTPGGISR
jgi:hypothetical protein